MSSSFAGVVFDMDGTLVDSLDSTDHCWSIVARTVGVLEEGQQAKDLDIFRPGLPAISSIRLMLQEAGLFSGDGFIDEGEVSYWVEFHRELELSYAWRAEALPYAHEVLSFLDSNEIPWGVATSCTAELGEARWAASGLTQAKVFHTFERDYFKGKPEGDAFYSAANKLELLDYPWIVVEDAVAGVESGLNAGGYVVAVEGSYTREDLLSAGANRVMKDLRELHSWLQETAFISNK